MIKVNSELKGFHLGLEDNCEQLRVGKAGMPR